MVLCPPRPGQPTPPAQPSSGGRRLILAASRGPGKAERESIAGFWNPSSLPILMPGWTCHPTFSPAPSPFRGTGVEKHRRQGSSGPSPAPPLQHTDSPYRAEPPTFPPPTPHLHWHPRLQGPCTLGQASLRGNRAASIAVQRPLVEPCIQTPGIGSVPGFRGAERQWLEVFADRVLRVLGEQRCKEGWPLRLAGSGSAGPTPAWASDSRGS